MIQYTQVKIAPFPVRKLKVVHYSGAIHSDNLKFPWGVNCMLKYFVVVQKVEILSM